MSKRKRREVGVTAFTTAVSLANDLFTVERMPLTCTVVENLQKNLPQGRGLCDGIFVCIPYGGVV